MLNVAPQKERIPDHLRAMAEQDDKPAAQGKQTGEQPSIGLACESQAGADCNCRPRSLAPRPTLSDLPKPPGVDWLPH